MNRSHRTHIVRFLVFLFCLSLTPHVRLVAEQIDSGVPGMIFEHNVAVPVSDGAAIRLNIYRPDKLGRYPVLMSMGPTVKTAGWIPSRLISLHGRA